MSTAHKFAVMRTFPTCLPTTGPSGNTIGFGAAAYVNGITLSQLMALYWNLETFTFTTSVSATKSSGGHTYIGSGNATFTVNPLGVTGDLARLDTYSGNKNAMMAGTSYSAGQGVNAPAKRVCRANANPALNPIINLLCSSSSGSQYESLNLEFAAEIDSTNASKFAVRYGIYIVFPMIYSGSVLGAQIRYTHLTVIGGTLINSGSFTIGGISFPYKCYYDTGTPTTSSGGTLTATSGSFTY